MQNKIKLLATSIVFGLFLFMAIATGNSNNNRDEIDRDLTKEEIKDAIKGKWRTSFSYGGAIYLIRFEIMDDKIKIWRKGNEMTGESEDYQDYNNEPDEIVNYSIGDMRIINQYWKQIDIAEGEFGKLVIIYYNEKDFGHFQYVNGSEESSMENDWKF